ncbi:MAG: metallophosphoesterase, partial [Myxococcales bacterium]|nr:metallophosphoesterase [Myxococcales bacterium]
MSTPRPLRWLHLSDLHLGCPGRSRWWTVHDVFSRHLREAVAEVGAPDVVLITGDLTHAATREQYDEVDALLDALVSWCGSAPIVIAVPGNHDVQPPKRRRTYMVLRELHRGRDDPAVAELLDELWTDRDAEFIEPLFAEYSAWLDRRVLAQGSEHVRVTKSHFPGDLTVELDLPGVVPARFVGLNTAWCQYTGTDDAAESYRGRLDVSLEQYHAALGARAGENPYARLREDARATVLLMHHPLAWLSPLARQRYFEGIHDPEHITICLHGHLHEARTEYLSVAGGRPRYYFQAPSLFGLENYGHANEKRETGYALGELSANGELRVWPFKGETKGDGALGFDRDTAFYWGSRGVVIRESPQTRASDRP